MMYASDNTKHSRAAALRCAGVHHQPSAAFDILVPQSQSPRPAAIPPPSLAPFVFKPTLGVRHEQD